MNQAVAWEYIPSNPAEKATLPRHRPKKREVWTAAEAKIALELCGDPVLKLAMLLAMQLRQNLTAAIDRLGQIVTDDAEASPAQISAARTLLDFNLKFTELTDVLDRLTELEKWRDESNG